MAALLGRTRAEEDPGPVGVVVVAAGLVVHAGVALYMARVAGLEQEVGPAAILASVGLAAVVLMWIPLVIMVRERHRR